MNPCRFPADESNIDSPVGAEVLLGGDGCNKGYGSGDVGRIIGSKADEGRDDSNGNEFLSLRIGEIVKSSSSETVEEGGRLLLARQGLFSSDAAPNNLAFFFPAFC